MALLLNVSKEQRSEKKRRQPETVNSPASATPQPLKPDSDRMKIELTNDDDDDFMPLKKKPTPNSEDLRSLFKVIL